MPRTTISQDLRRLRKLKGDRDTAKERYERHERAFKAFQAQCLERMEAEGVEGHKAWGTSFSPVRQVYASIQDRSEFVAWAKENDTELVEEKERAALLNALVRERLDNGEALPPGCGFYERAYVSMRGSS